MDTATVSKLLFIFIYLVGMFDFMYIVTPPLALSAKYSIFTESFVIFEVSGEVVLEAYDLGVVILDDEFQLFLFLEEAFKVPLNYFSHYHPFFIF